MRSALRSIAYVAVVITALGAAVFAVSRSPAAAFHPSSFAAFGWHLTLADAYADPSSTVLDFSGVPPKTILGGVLYDQFGIEHLSTLGRNDDRGNYSADYDRLGWQASLLAMRYTLVLEDHPVATFTVPPGGGLTLPAPVGGSFGTGSVEFSNMRYGGRTLFLDVYTRGVDVVGGFECGEACLPSPWAGLEMQLIPVDGRPAVGIEYNSPGRADDVVVHGVAMLVDPGAYTLVLTLGPVVMERAVVVG